MACEACRRRRAAMIAVVKRGRKLVTDKTVQVRRQCEAIATMKAKQEK